MITWSLMLSCNIYYLKTLHNKCLSDYCWRLAFKEHSRLSIGPCIATKQTWPLPSRQSSRLKLLASYFASSICSIQSASLAHNHVCFWFMHTEAFSAAEVVVCCWKQNILFAMLAFFPQTYIKVISIALQTFHICLRDQRANLCDNHNRRCPAMPVTFTALGFLCKLWFMRSHFPQAPLVFPPRTWDPVHRVQE